MADVRALSVRWHGRSVGELRQTPAGRLAFRYLESWRVAHGPPLSCALPVREEEYGHDASRAFFGGYLPDSDVARQALARLFHASAGNDFSLLAEIGRDCAGAVSLLPPDEPAGGADAVGRYQPLPSAELADLLRALPSRPLFTARQDVRLSLAGAQDKAAVAIFDAELHLPLQGAPSSHIVKPAVAGLGGYVQHEHLCLRVAKRVGLPVVDSEVRRAEDVTYLLVRRYDRVIGDDGRIRRRHQEDTCQALGVLSSQKYQNEGGPGLAEVFALIDEGTSPAVDRIALRDWVLLNVLLGNADAHAKNVSILHEPRSFELAPFYDLSCGALYDLADRMAMKLGGTYDVDVLAPRHWQRFAADVGLAFPPLRERLEQLAAALPDALSEEAALLRDAGHDHPVLERMLALVPRRVSAVVRTIRD